MLLGGCTERNVRPSPANAALELYQITESEFQVLQTLDRLVREWNVARQSGSDAVQEARAHEVRHLAGQHEALLRRMMEENYLAGKTVAALALGFSASPEALELLLGALRDPTAMVRANAAHGIGLMGFAETPAEPLVALLRDSSPEVRTGASFALSRILREGQDRGAIGGLLEALKDSDDSVRNNAVRALQVVRAKEALPVLRREMLRDSSPLVRYNTVLAMAVFGEPDSVEPLIGCLTDSEEIVRRAAVVALKRVTGEVSLGNDPEAWRRWWAENKGRFDAPETPQGTKAEVKESG